MFTLGRLRRFVLFLLLWNLVLVGAVSPAAPLAQAQPARPTVAYIYSTDLASRDSFVATLSLRGFDVVALPISAPAGTPSAETFDFRTVQAVIIGDDTGTGVLPADWGTRTARANLARAERYTIGIGVGGGDYFGARDLFISYGQSWFSTGKRAYVLSPGVAFWNTPRPVAVGADNIANLYSRNVSYLAVHNPDPVANVIRIARQTDDQDHYPLIAQLFNGQFGEQCNVFWGFRQPPRVMTAAGANLFENLLRNNACTSQGLRPASADLSLVKQASPGPATVGQNLTYTLLVQNNSKADAPNVRVVDTLPAGALFVSATASQGTCSRSGQTVTCNLGTLAGLASATVTIVVKPSEEGLLNNAARVTSGIFDPKPDNNLSAIETPVSQPSTFKPLLAIPVTRLPALTALLPAEDLSIHGIEITQGIQCFNTAQGLATCPDNSLPVVTRKGTTARIYLRYNGPFTSKNNVPVRLFIRANGVDYTANAVARALPTLDQSSASNSANIWLSVNFNSSIPVDFYAIVDPDNTLGETNESNNRYPASGSIRLNFTPRKTMTIVSQRLRYHPSGYTGGQYAGGWAVDGGAALWFNQLLPIRDGGINHRVASGYLSWKKEVTSGDGQHDLIKHLNSNYTLQNLWVYTWLFGPGPYTNARHVYGWVPSGAGIGGHADMPVYPHAGGLGVVGIGTDTPGTSTDNPGTGALIFGHELVHNYNVKHTDVSGDCGSSDSSSDFPYSTASIQEFGYNPATGKVYNPNNTHDLMSYCPAGGSREGWISPFTWNKMYNAVSPSVATAEAETAATITGGALMVDITVTNPDLGPQQATFNTMYRVEGDVPAITPQKGEYVLELRDGTNTVLGEQSFALSFESEYHSGVSLQHGGHDEPGHPEPTPLASAVFSMPWANGATSMVLRRGAQVLASQPISANAPVVQLTTPSAATTWPAGSTQRITWQANDPDGGALRYSVFYSNDGTDWDLLADELTDAQYDVDVDSLAGGVATYFRVVASDGVNTGYDETPAAITIPDKKPTAGIANPVNGAVLDRDTLLVLQGFGSDLEDGTLPDAVLSWADSRQGQLGTGSSLPVSDLLPGEHTITLTVTDSAGQQTTATAQVYVGSRVWLPLVQRQ
ncbi:MAG: DUF11 domain-containing protein [Chloroflexaceae bacterium]|nr:DUF11 domain-containing protein [Chloroflexaceae bacterium]